MTTNEIAQRPLESQPRAIVVGASSGLGAALVAQLARRGYRVAALARREALLTELAAALTAEQALPAGTILTFPHNALDIDEIPELFQNVCRELGGLDLFIYCAGVQPSVGPDEYNTEKDAAMIRVNLLGAIAWLNQAAVRFSRAGSGHIAAIGSVAGDRGRRGAPGYNTSKAGLHTFMEALRNRLTVQGVTVTTVKPGQMQTALLENAAKTLWVVSPEDAADQICRALVHKRQTVYVPGRWALLMLIIRHVPSFIFRRLNF